jgi:Leucine-rich repeat (LRR) protein
VPEAIGNLTALTTLDLSDNQLTAVPKAIGTLISLAELELSGNPITEQPNGPTSTDAERT